MKDIEAMRGMRKEERLLLAHMLWDVHKRCEVTLMWLKRWGFDTSEGDGYIADRLTEAMRAAEDGTEALVGEGRGEGIRARGLRWMQTRILNTSQEM